MVIDISLEQIQELAQLLETTTTTSELLLESGLVLSGEEEIEATLDKSYEYVTLLNKLIDLDKEHITH